MTCTPDRVQFGRTKKHKFDYSAPKGNRKMNLGGLGRNKSSTFGYKHPNMNQMPSISSQDQVKVSGNLESIEYSWL